MVIWRCKSVNREKGMKGETRGNRDEWKGIGDVTEIEQTWNGEGIAGQAEQNRLCWRFIGNPVSNNIKIPSWSKIDPLLLSNSIPTILQDLQHYIIIPWEFSNSILIFIILFLVLLHSISDFISLSQSLAFHFQYIAPFQYSCTPFLAPTLPLNISASILLNSYSLM